MGSESCNMSLHVPHPLTSDVLCVTEIPRLMSLGRFDRSCHNAAPHRPTFKEALRPAPQDAVYHWPATSQHPNCQASWSLAVLLRSWATARGPRTGDLRLLLIPRTRKSRRIPVCLLRCVEHLATEMCKCCSLGQKLLEGPACSLLHCHLYPISWRMFGGPRHIPLQFA